MLGCPHGAYHRSSRAAWQCWRRNFGKTASEAANKGEYRRYDHVRSRAIHHFMDMARAEGPSDETRNMCKTPSDALQYALEIDKRHHPVTYSIVQQDEEMAKKYVLRLTPPQVSTATCRVVIIIDGEPLEIAEISCTFDGRTKGDYIKYLTGGQDIKYIMRPFGHWEYMINQPEYKLLYK